MIYGKAFDILRVKTNIDLTDENEIRCHLDDIVLYEIKSTSKANIPADFRGYFFSLDPRRKAEARDSRGGAEVHDDPPYYGTWLCPTLDRASRSGVRLRRGAGGWRQGIVRPRLRPRSRC